MFRGLASAAAASASPCLRGETVFLSVVVSPRPAAPSRFALSASLFLRVLAVIHALAFASAWTQLAGLVGPQGILPAQPFFDAVLRQLGPDSAHAQLPSLCWFIGAGPTALNALSATGLTLSLLLFIGIAPAPALLGLWACYLSLCGAGQMFFGFQWDALLLETTLLSVFLAPWRVLPLWHTAHSEPPRLARFLLIWLLFRLMLLSGAVKLLSGDLSWRDLSALTFHYETQPLPTPLAYWAHALPAWFHRAACAAMFTLELIIPFFFFAPRALRHRAALLSIALMLLIALTGNYTYFNLLTAALCLLCLDDPILPRLIPRRLSTLCHLISDKLFLRPKSACHLLSDNHSAPDTPPIPPLPPRWHVWPVRIFAAFVLLYTGLDTVSALIRTLPPIPGFNTVAAVVAPYRSFNRYGLFAVMTHPRRELIFEGSDDTRTWLPYEFPHKPGDLARAPTWIAPHQPRLDWQLWFAALGHPTQNRWVLAVCEHLLRGTPDVLTLVEKNPFPQKPPRHIRVVRYEYHFTDPATRARTGQVWRRTPLELYIQPAALK